MVPTDPNEEVAPYEGPEIGPDSDPETLWQDLTADSGLAEPGVVSADQPTHSDEQLDTPMPPGDGERSTPFDAPEVNDYPEEGSA